MTPEQIRKRIVGHKSERRAYRELTGGCMPANWQQHTVDTEQTPESVEDDLAQVPAAFHVAKYAWMFVVGCALGYLLGRYVAPWIFGN